MYEHVVIRLEDVPGLGTVVPDPLERHHVFVSEIAIRIVETALHQIASLQALGVQLLLLQPTGRHADHEEDVRAVHAAPRAADGVAVLGVVWCRVHNDDERGAAVGTRGRLLEPEVGQVHQTVVVVRGGGCGRQRVSRWWRWWAAGGQQQNAERCGQPSAQI